jgi:hypothetical protein
MTSPRRFQHSVTEPQPNWEEDEIEMLEIARIKNSFNVVAALVNSECNS